MKSRTEDIFFWKQRIKERIESEMSVLKWCKISKNMYHYWNHKINKKQQSGNEAESAKDTFAISNVYKSEINHWKLNDFQMPF